MGLDNGIEIKRNEKSMNIYNKLKKFELSYDEENKLDFEVAYYRKCWNIRNIIASCIGGLNDNLETPIERVHIPKIISALKSLNKENWEDEGDSIWTYEEQEPFIRQHIKNLKYLYKLMAKYDLDVYFYDSY